MNKMEIYSVKYEANDKGWRDGNNFFANADDAVKHMRRYIANMLFIARENGLKISYLTVFDDVAMESKEAQKTQTIEFGIKYSDGHIDRYDFRVWAAPLHKSEMPFIKEIGYYWL